MGIVHEVLTKVRIPTDLLLPSWKLYIC